MGYFDGDHVSDYVGTAFSLSLALAIWICLIALLVPRFEVPWRTAQRDEAAEELRCGSRAARSTPRSSPKCAPRSPTTARVTSDACTPTSGCTASSPARRRNDGVARARAALTRSCRARPDAAVPAWPRGDAPGSPRRAAAARARRTCGATPAASAGSPTEEQREQEHAREAELRCADRRCEAERRVRARRAPTALGSAAPRAGGAAQALTARRLST